MEVETVPETSDCISVLTRLIALENFIAISPRENLKSFSKLPLKCQKAQHETQTRMYSNKCEGIILSDAQITPLEKESP
jgi:hypothetical protein